MLTILDKFILKRYLSTFITMLLLFTPIGILIDVSEKISFMIENEVPFIKVAIYYFHFTIYFANSLFPIFLFLSIIWFTSKMANDTEIIAILSSGISFSRFLRPYIIGATLVSLVVLIMGFFVVPIASEGFNNFRYTYLRNNGQQAMLGETTDVYRQISKKEFLFVNNFNPVAKTGFNFTLEKFDKEKLVSKMTASRITWDPADSTYILYDYNMRTVGVMGDKIEKMPEKRMLFKFDLEDLTPVVYKAETLTLDKLNAFIDKEKARGSSNINLYMVVLYKKYSVPVSAFILTIIAVSVSSMKRRGGMGLNLTIGIAIAFSFVFFDKIFFVLAEKSTFSPFLAVWIPNFIFTFLAIFLLRNAKR